MSTGLELAVNTSLLFIGNYLSVNAVMFPRGTEAFTLPCRYLTNRENEIVRSLLAEAPAPSVYFVRDSLYAEYCFAFIEQCIVFIGPYRTHLLRSAELPADRFPSEEDKKAYLTRHNSYPMHSRSAVRLAVDLLFTGVCGSTAELPKEGDIDMRGRLNEQDYLAALSQPAVSVGAAMKHEGFQFYYITQVCSGNTKSAIQCYHHIMNARAPSFILINTIEGLSTMRCLTGIAMHEAGVPENSAEAVLNDFKLHGRLVTSIPQAKRLCEKMIDDACRLVRAQTTERYSPTIARAVDYIHRNLSDPLTLPGIASEVGLTPNAFTTKFHAEVGVTPTAYITGQRMEQAAKLLAYTPMSIQHICTRVGMLDANYLTRCFRKAYGMTPTEYRHRHAGNTPVTDENGSDKAAPSLPVQTDQA